MNLALTVGEDDGPHAALAELNPTLPRGTPPHRPSCTYLTVAPRPSHGSTRRQPPAEPNLADCEHIDEQAARLGGSTRDHPLNICGLAISVRTETPD